MGMHLDLDEFDEQGNRIKQKRDMSDFQVLKRIMGFISQGRFKKYIAAFMIIMVIGSVLGFLMPLVFEQIINVGLNGGKTNIPFTQANYDALIFYGKLLAVVIIVGFGSWIGQQYLTQYLAIHVMYYMREKLFLNLQRLSFDYYDDKNRSTGKIISYLTNDTETIQDLISSGLLSVIGSVISFTGSLVFMIVISWQLSIVALGIISIIVVFGILILLKARSYIVLMRRKVAKVTGNLQESISGMRVIKAFAIEEQDYEIFDKNTDEQLESTLKAQKLFSALPGLVIACLGSGLGVILIFGARLEFAGILNTGQIFAFVLYLVQFFGPLAQIVGFINQIQNSMTAGERIVRLVDLKPTVINRPETLELTEKGKILFTVLEGRRKASKIYGNKIIEEISWHSKRLGENEQKLLKAIGSGTIEIEKLEDILEMDKVTLLKIAAKNENSQFIVHKQPLELETVNGHVEFKEVRFSYVPDIEVIKGLSMNIKEKERVAIVGYTGAGKSTLINLFGRFYDVTDGSILIDDHDVRDINIQSLRKNCGIVLQDNYLFSGTVLNNIRYGKPKATEEEVMEAAKKVGAHEFIMELPNGYNTEIEERGNLLSIGQKQLIAFARALIRDPPILILDEATSAVDPYSELIIQQALEVLLKNRTSISIAHRLSTIINSDRIFVLDDGQIVENGSHSELLKKKGLYYQLFSLQYRDAYKDTGIETPARNL